VNVTALAGGVGGAKMSVGLQSALDPGELTVVVNTGDDATIYGVHVAPDVDIVTYWLAGVADEARGWGLRGDAFTVIEALERLGAPAWFRLGDRDLATCLWRTQCMAAGMSLSAATDQTRRALGVSSRVLPMSDDPVRTLVHCVDGRTLEFQEYFVRERTQPEVAALDFEGADVAKPAPGVIEAIEAASKVVLCPSNPYLSMAPILALAGVRDALVAHPCVVAVTPIVRGAALKGPAARLIAGFGEEPSAAAVARAYAGICNAFVVDSSDLGQLDEVAETGVRAIALDTVMDSRVAARELATQMLGA
jgi:LPPG:FO 2-phospho-L-lactate transferase